MAVVLGLNSFTINGVFTMAYADLPNALTAALAHASSTGQVEHDLRAYAAGGCPVPQTVAAVSQVCVWGGQRGPFVAARVLAGNMLAHISSQLNNGTMAANAAVAIQSATQIFGLGISFGSKHLRMMNPNDRVVLDRILSKRLQYPLTDVGYADLCADCLAIANQVNPMVMVNPIDANYAGFGLANPRGAPHAWWPADIEMALFAESHPDTWSASGTWVGLDTDDESCKSRSRRTAPRQNSTTQGPSQVAPYTSSFEGFWNWLRAPRTSVTIGGKSTVTGLTDQTHLRLTTNNEVSMHPIRKATVERYCEKIFWDQFQKLKGNVRWVAALLAAYLGEVA